jgi:hypothetical protein
MHDIRRRQAFVSAMLALSAAACGSSSSVSATSASELAPIHGRYAPSTDPANFVARVDNPLWPLVPGTRFHFEGTRGKVAQTDDEVVMHRTEQILRVRCTVVRDTVSVHGRPIERTLDFYAQDKQGNVWYMGEDSFERKGGRFVRASDSWRSGVDGAKPGIIMAARPRSGDSYRQEYYPRGESLDEARVLGYRGSVSVPYGTFKRALATREFTPSEPVIEEKYYAAGVGEIGERVVKGPHEEFRLVSVTRP